MVASSGTLNVRSVAAEIGGLSFTSDTITEKLCSVKWLLLYEPRTVSVYEAMDSRSSGTAVRTIPVSGSM